MTPIAWHMLAQPDVRNVTAPAGTAIPGEGLTTEEAEPFPMDTPQVIAPPRAPSRGIVHQNVRHTTHFTVIGNHLAQHSELSLVAIGLATHIQSLPAGAKVGVKCLTERFPESETRIAGALRELEEHGYLTRERERLPNGRVVTRTTSYNQPRAAVRPASRAPVRTPVPRPAPPAPPAPPAAVAPLPPRPEPPAKRPPLPRPQAPHPELHRAARTLLLGLRREAAEIVLHEGDIAALTPAVAAWLERDVTPAAIARALTNDLPVPLKCPARLLAHRLATGLPAPLPAAERAGTHDAIQNCDGCDRGFRAPEPGYCADCRGALPTTA